MTRTDTSCTAASPERASVRTAYRALCCVCLMLLTAFAAAADTRDAQSAKQRAPRNETRLAGLQPGRDTFQRATALYGKNYSEAFPNAPDVLLWADPSKQVYLTIELTADKTINAITVSTYGPEKAPQTRLPATATASGGGLRLGDPLEKTLRIYGQPYFQGASTDGGRNVLLVVHKFNVSEELPQVMETSYDPQTRKLVKVTLTFPYY